jgi:hypothetical protein
MNPHHGSYQEYGGAGVKISPRWDKFDDFLADMGQPPSTMHSLDRFPNSNGNYEPGNCRWATPKEQIHNSRTLKLGDWDIRFIRHWRARGFTHKAIAEAFNVDRSSIGKIVRYQRRQTDIGGRHF